MLEISPAKVALVILKAREFDVKVDTENETASISDTASSADELLEERSSDAIRSEVAEFIAGLNEDDQANLVALAWLGRGTYSVEEFEKAVAVAKDEHITQTADYLLGIPLLSEYLEGGLEKLGYPVDAVEKDIP